MASALYPTGKKKMVDNDFDIQADAATKLMLVKSTYTYVGTHEFIDNAGANDPIDEEADCTGYTGGFGGADRLVPASRTTTVNGAIVEFAFTFDELVGNVNTNGGDLTYDPNDTTNGKMFDW
jgi:hypothetical protein